MTTDWHITHAHPGTGPSEQGGCPQNVAITTEEGESVDVWGPTAQGQAALIVRAVIAHDALVAALQRLTLAAASRENTMGDPINLLNASAELRAATAQAFAELAQVTKPDASTH